MDLDYRHVFLCDNRYSLNYLVGIRYANLTQSFRSQFDSIISENVNTDVNFDGAGFRLGLEGERYSPCHVIFLYGKASASFLGGEFRGNYLQTSTNDPIVAETSWKEARFVSILDCEVGVGWTGCNGHVKASAGYMLSIWTNVREDGRLHHRGPGEPIPRAQYGRQQRIGLRRFCNTPRSPVVSAAHCATAKLETRETTRARAPRPCSFAFAAFIPSPFERRTIKASPLLPAGEGQLLSMLERGKG